MSQTAKIAIIVEPDMDVGIGFARDLARLGLDSFIVSDVTGALECMAGTNPDVVLVSCDVVEAGAIRRLVRRARTDAAVILVAGQVDVLRIGAAIWQGAAECLVRPFGQELLEFKLVQTGVLGQSEQAEIRAAQ